jgi:two-component system cell cycle response regulator
MQVKTSVAQTSLGGSANRARPVIGLIANLADYAALSPLLAGDGVTRMLDERSAIAAVRTGTVDLLIVAPRSDWWAEVAGVADLEAEAKRAQVTVLAMVPRGDSAALAAAFDSGVADCVAYPFDADEVVVRVRTLLRRKAAAERRRADAAEVRRLALTDPVTGLWNRHHLDADLAVKIARAQATARPLSLLMIDIDRFKPINDRHGHAIGDKVLRSVAARLAGGIRSGDTLARFGGDELALVMPDTALAVAAGVAERLRGLVADNIEVPFAVTVSIGVAELAFDEPAELLLIRADRALYAAKFDGRNCIAAAS